MSNTLRTKIVLEGEKEYKKSLNDLTQANKLYGAELKENITRHKNDADSRKGLVKSNEILSKSISSQTKKLDLLSKKHKEVSDTYGSASSQAMKLETQLLKEKTALNNLNNQYDNNKKKIAELEKGNNKLVSSTKKSGNSMDKTGKQSKGLRNSFNNLSSSTKNLVKGFGLMLGAKAIKGAVTGMMNLAKEAGKLADELYDLADITGMSVEEIQKYKGITIAVGIDANAFTKASEKLTKEMSNIENGSGKASKSIELLGISSGELSNMTADEQLSRVTEALADVEDSTERARIGTDLFGGTWSDIAPGLAIGSEEMRKLKENANVIDEDTLAKANAYDKAMATLSETVNVVKQQLGSMLAEYLTPLITFITETAIPYINDFFSTMKETEWFDVLSTVFSSLSEIVTTLVDTIVRIATNIKGSFDDMSIDVGASIEILMEIIENLKKVFESIFKVIEGLVSVFIALIKGDFEGLKTALSSTFNAIRDLFSALFDTTILLLTTFVTNFKNKLKNAFESTKKIAIGFKDDFIDIFKKLPEAMLNVGKNLVDSLKRGISSQWQSILEYAKGLVNNLKDMFTIDLNPFKSKSVSISKSVSNSANLNSNLLKGTTNNKVNNMSSSLNIENFINNSNIDIRQISKQLAELSARQNYSTGGVYA